MAGTNQSTQQNKSSSISNQQNFDLGVLFFDGKYSLLLDSLKKDGIFTVEQFRNFFNNTSFINYLNKNDLYTWSIRLQIIEELIPIIKDTKIEIKSSSSQPPTPRKQSREGDLFVNFSKDEDYSFSYPTHLILGNKNFPVKKWRDVLRIISENMIEKYPDDMLSLTYTPVNSHSSRLIIFKDPKKALAPRKLSNGTWLETNFNAKTIIKTIKEIIDYCGHPLSDIVIYYEKQIGPSTKSKINYLPSFPIEKKSVREIRPQFSVDIEVIKNFILSKGLSGCSIDEIYSTINKQGFTKRSIFRIIESCNDIVEISKGVFVHRKRIVDLDEAAEILLRILKKQFGQFDGYSNITLLFDAARIDLPLFMNDNAFDGETTIYFLAKHLFEKEGFAGHHFIFYGNTHIWEKQPDYELSVKGLLVNQARLAGGLISRPECEAYFSKIKLGMDSFIQGKLTNEHTFYLYETGVYLLAEKINIDDVWKDQIKRSLDALFQSNAYVIPRDIADLWFSRLPELPLMLPWTVLLLQEILLTYNLGYKPIFAPLQQGKDTIAAAIVPEGSDLKTFSDIVFTYLSQKVDLPKRMEKDELHLILRDAGIINGNELIFKLHKALNEYRFSWQDNNNKVFIQRR